MYTYISDKTLERIPNYVFQTSYDSSLSVYGFQQKNFDYQAVAIWMDGKIPHDSLVKTLIDFEFPAGKFDHPVYVDMRTGQVYEIPKDNWTRRGTLSIFREIPIYDSPILIADISLISMQ